MIALRGNVTNNKGAITPRNMGEQRMKTTLNTWQIADALKQDENAGWSYEGAKALAEYLEQYEEDTGEELELDVVAIRCDFTEYTCATEAAENYADHDYDDDMDDDEKEAAALKYLEDNTTVIEFDGGIIIHQF